MKELETPATQPVSTERVKYPKCFIGNLPDGVQEHHIRDLLQGLEVKNVDLNQTKKIAFVEFGDEESLTSAINIPNPVSLFYLFLFLFFFFI